MLRSYLVGGRLPVMPRPGVKRRLLLGYLATAFQPGVYYSEAEVNATVRMWIRTWPRCAGIWSMRASWPERTVSTGDPAAGCDRASSLAGPKTPKPQ